MSATLTEPQANGKHDVLADLEQCVRRNAALPVPAADPTAHAFLKTAHGVIHIGAHAAQERDIYGSLPVVWVEALPLVYNVLLEQIADRPQDLALCYLVADGERYKFGVSNNAGQSSSIFDFARHKELWSNVGHVAAVEMESVELGDIILRHDLDPSIYDVLVLDVQGAELLVLQGAGDHLSQFGWILAEAADFEAYRGGCQLRDLDAYLTTRGFVREALLPGLSKEGVGSYYDALYRNTNHMPLRGRVQEKFAPQLRSILEEKPQTGIPPLGSPWETPPLRLNLGAGLNPLPGFTSIDRKLGSEVYPLAYPDGSAEEIVASHVLEHFGHRQIRAVLTDWVRALKPGGKLRVAVPDTEEVTRLYNAGAAVNIQGYLMGGQNDDDDFHRCLFDRESLTEELMSVGLERIGAWDTVAAGCAAGPHSLNLQAFKPAGPEERLSGVRAVMSVPRFGPLMHPRCAERAFFQLGIEARSTSSCYWAQQISNLMADAAARPDCDFVLTMDFDTIFCAADVLELYRLLKSRPDVDAVFPMQAKRGCEDVLFSIAGKTPGTCKTSVSNADLMRNLLPANTGHFGLTLFRADSLRKFPRPWMVPAPNANGEWRDGHTDADIDFWSRFRAAGFVACLAPKVVVGHLEEVVKWPGKDLKPVYQSTADYDENGIPAQVER